MDDVIKTISYDQDEILRGILHLYVPEGRFDVDPTYSKGNFYRNIPEPAYKFDIVPQSDQVIQADCRDLPLENASVHSVIFDPPFLATTGKSLNTENGNIINRRFSVCSSERELQDLYTDSIHEFYRVLDRNGILVFKCQDKVSSGKQHFMHCFVYEQALRSRFEPMDLFVLCAKSRIIADWQRNQKHARKYHSYFWVFKKKIA